MKFPLLLRRRRKRERELDEEIGAHLAMAVRERIERGEDHAEAEANARRELGNVALIIDVTCDVWGLRWLETLLQDLRYGLRQLRRNAGFTIVAILNLALGIGGTTPVAMIIDRTVLHALPFPNSDRLMDIGGAANPPPCRPGRHALP